jgi:hypothetical protein
MNEGTLAILIQWCLLCLVWMGSLDLLLRELKVSRKHVLAVLTVFLLSSFVVWPLSFAPVEISLTGTILPLILCGWLYRRLPHTRRRFHLLATVMIAWLLFWLRWAFFTDPIMLFWDEGVIIPVVALITVMIGNRQGMPQLFSLLFSVVLSDAIHALYFTRLSGTCVLGDGFAQDLIWSSFSLWCVLRVIWLWICRMSGRNNTEPSNSDARR